MSWYREVQPRAANYNDLQAGWYQAKGNRRDAFASLVSQPKGGLMRVRYAVTFEFMNKAPVTHRGEVEGGSPATLAHRAVRDAKQALGMQTAWWSSMNCVLLERLDAPAETDSEVENAQAAGGSAEEDETP
jgi:hypothetical protein